MKESTTPSAEAAAKPKGPLNWVIGILGSYGLCCLCLSFLFVLTLFGTLHQRDHGLYEAKKMFFNSFFLWREVGGMNLPIFPGGVTSMMILTLNLIVGGLLRINWAARNAGVILIHFGIIFMMGAGLVKMTNSQEGHLTLWEEDNSRTLSDERRSGHFQSYTLWEVAIWEMEGKASRVEYIIPDDSFTFLTGGQQRVFRNADLPFDLTLRGFVKNCNVLPKGPNWEATGEVIDGYGILKFDPDSESERNLAGMHAEVMIDGKVERSILFGAQRTPWIILADGKRFAIDMRHTRYSMPYDIRLEDFVKEDHPGMSMAKAFRSVVTRIDGRGDEKILIQMNEPLRDGGLVLFQSSWGPSNARPGDPLFSVFSVVRNPSDKWPEYAMWVIALGLLITFCRTLFRFSRKQLAEFKKKISTQS
ncbi:MAG: hypothetical protein ACI8QS_000178 [Planctomycetota bacterium]